MRRSLRAFMTGGTALALAITAGCGSGTVSDPGSQEHAGHSGNAAISIETTRGPVKLDKPATKVVSLEWSYTEELLGLGVTPVGSADTASYKTWVSAPGSALPPNVADVGKRQEPSLEKIKALQPDLIVADQDRIKTNYDQLAAIAPVVSFNPTAQPALKNMKKNFTELAEAVGKQDKATEVLGKLDAKATEVKGRLERGGKAGSEYTVAQGTTTNGSPSIRMFTDQSLIAQVINQTGLKNTWQGHGDEWGMTTVGVEGLTQIPPTSSFLYVAAVSNNPFTGALAGNPVWQGLEFVKQGRAKPMDPGTWVFGGPLTAIQILDETAKAHGV